LGELGGINTLLSATQIDHLKEISGVDVTQARLLSHALTHSSMGGKDNERLEFLGDRVLGLVIAEYLYHKRPQEEEGHMAKRFARLVSKDILAEVAIKIGLDDIVIISKSEENTGGRTNSTILADCCEAVIAALYIEFGWNTARHFIMNHWKDYLMIDQPPPRDPKTILQEWAQAKGLALPQYQILSQSGPSHQPLFEVAVHIPGYQMGRGSGSSKKLAERQAAENFIEIVGWSKRTDDND